MTPGLRLRTALKAVTRDTHDAIKDAGIEPRLFRRAILGQPVNASTHLRICGLLALDPMTGDTGQVRILGDLHLPSLSAALRMKRFADNLDLRRAANQARMSYSSLGRIERGDDVSIEAILAACRWLDRHPFDFVSPRDTYATSGETSHTSRSAA